MAWIAPVTVVAGQMADEDFWNAQVKDNSVALRAGGLELSGMATNDLIVASSATALRALAKGVDGTVPYFNGTEWVMVKLADLVYPIGTILWTVAAADPGTTVGGVWAAYAAGRMVVGVDAADPTFATEGARGGAKTHTLTELEMPLHGHTLTDSGHFHLVGYDNFGNGSEFATDALTNYPGGQQRTVQTKTTGVTIANAGSGAAHNNLPPYLVVYMWERVA